MIKEGSRVIVLMKDSLYYGYKGTVTAVEDDEVWVNVNIIETMPKEVRLIRYPLNGVEEIEK